MARVLVVEDDIDLAERLKDWLTFQKHMVEAVHSGTEALEQLQYGEFDIAVMDWQLPGMDGPDVCKEYRSGGGAIPILLLTGRDGSAARTESLEAGATDFLPKPFHLKDLSARLESLLAGTSAT